ncbi:MAG TPA: hypothetical protein VF930_05830 [Stellaceae bacterium]
MTVSSPTFIPPQYAGNGATTIFGFQPQFFDPADLVVSLFDTTANAAVSPAPQLNGLGTYDYTVTGTKDPNTGEYIAGGNVVFNNAPLANHRVTIQRNVAATQGVVLTDGGSFRAKIIEGELDRLTLIVQQVLAAVALSYQNPASDPPGASVIAPLVATRALQFAGWDALGNLAALAPPATTTAVSAVMAPVIGAATLAVAKNLLDVPFSLFAAPASTPYAVRAPQDIGTLFSSESMGAAGTFNLPSAATAGAGAGYAFVKRTNNLTLNRAGTDVIQGIGATFTTLTLTVDGDMLAIESDGTNWKVIAAAPNVWALLGGFGPAFIRGFIDGGETGAPGGAQTLTIGPIACVDNTNANLMKVGSTFTKTMAAWAVGSGNGALDTGAVASGTPYFVWVIQRLDTGVTDYLISLSGTAPTMPANYTVKRGPIAWFKTDGSSFIPQYQQRGDDFVYGVSLHDVALTGTFGVAATLQTLTLPSGFQVTAKLRVGIGDAAATGAFSALLTSPDETDQAPAARGPASITIQTANASANSELSARSNISAQVRVRSTAANQNLDIWTAGFNWARGRNT